MKTPKQRFEYTGLFLLLFFFPLLSLSQNLRINEFMALNDSSIVDGDGDYSDWIELFNPSAEDILLSGWSLTDDSSDMHKWLFPADTLNAGGYLLVFASGKDSIAENEWHTNFKLSADGEYLALVAADSTVISEFNPAFPVQKSNFSFAFFDGAYWETATPTPAAENILTEDPALAPPVFSHQHGFYETPFFLKIETEGATKDIYYTTDGSEPSFSNGILYSDSIEISTTTCLRAVTVKNDSISRITTATFLFLYDVINQSNTPPGYPSMWGPYHAISGTAIADYEMDPEIVQDPEWSDVLDDALLALPTISIVTKPGNLFAHSLDPDTGGIYIYTGDADDDPDRQPGLGWERPASVEYFNSSGSSSFQIDCGIRIHGGHSRRPEKTPKHSFRIVFKSEYGASRLDFPLLDGETANESHNSVVLRAGFGNMIVHHSHTERIRLQYVRDQWAKQTQLDMGHLAGHYSYAHLYLNGIYWGIYSPAERLDKDFAESYYGGEPDNFDIIKDYVEVVDGNDQAWNTMISIANSGLSEDENYQRLLGNNPDGTRNLDYPVYLDINNYIDYMLINYFGGNSDWDHHNWAAIRDRTNPDRGFQFYSWDAEHNVKELNANNLDKNNSSRPSGLFQALKENESFRRLFADRVQLHFFNDGVLTQQKNTERWMSLANQVEPAIIAEVARWGDYRRDVHRYQTAGPFELYTKQHWQNVLDYITNEFFPQRGSVFIDQLQGLGLFPNTTAPQFLINGEEVTDNIISKGDTLTIVSNGGDIYYTTTGSDVIENGNSEQADSYTLISRDAQKKTYIPTENIGSTWFLSLDFDDSQWSVVDGTPGGIGYENGSGYEGFISLDVGSQMSGSNPSCYVRFKFNVDAETLDNINRLLLYVLYDDGFSAFLNGQLVASANAPSPLSYNSFSTSGHEAGDFIAFNISQAVEFLVEGENLLAIQGLNTSLTSSDFIINAELIGSEETMAGGISAEAVLYDQPVILNESSYIKARTYSGTEWSALSERIFSIPADIFAITVSEIHYHPFIEDSTMDDRLYEFIELKNKSTASLDLNDVHFSNGVSYQFKEGNILTPGAYIVLASDKDKFSERYGFLPFDEYEGYLDNSGERIVLRTSLNDTIINIRYNDNLPWPVEADGLGFSMVPLNPDSVMDFNDGNNWRASLLLHGSPGMNDIMVGLNEDPDIESPAQYSLYQNYPNPFNPQTIISYELKDRHKVRLIVYDIMGKEVQTLVNKYQHAGKYSVVFDAGGLASGIYFYKLETERYTSIKKMIFLK